VYLRVTRFGQFYHSRFKDLIFFTSDRYFMVRVSKEGVEQFAFYNGFDVKKWSKMFCHDRPPDSVCTNSPKGSFLFVILNYGVLMAPPIYLLIIFFLESFFRRVIGCKGLPLFIIYWTSYSASFFVGHNMEYRPKNSLASVLMSFRLLTGLG